MQASGLSAPRGRETSKLQGRGLTARRSATSDKTTEGRSSSFCRTRTFRLKRGGKAAAASTARASASLVGVAYKLRSWYVAFHYDVALLRLESYQQDALWGDATVNTDETGVLKMLVLSPANGDADADSALLGGRDIPIATLTFVVQAAATGTHGAAVSLSILSMTNFGTVSTASPNPDPES